MARRKGFEARHRHFIGEAEQAELVKARKKSFEVDRRVAIAMDALTLSQKAILDPLLRDKERFIEYAAGHGRTERLSSTKPIYKMSVGSGLRVIYSSVDDNIVILDVMHKTTMDRFGSKKKRKVDPPKKIQDDSTVKLEKS